MTMPDDLRRLIDSWRTTAALFRRESVGSGESHARCGASADRLAECANDLALIIENARVGCERCGGTGLAPAIRGDRAVPGETMPCPACLHRSTLRTGKGE